MPTRILVTATYIRTMNYFSMLLYLPAFPFMAKALGVPMHQVQYTFGTYMLGVSLGQLLAGPLSDRYGRKWPLLLSCLLFSLCCMASTQAETLWQLLLLRLGQGLGISTTLLLSRVLLTDTYAPAQIARYFSMMAFTQGSVIIGAPLLGSYLAQQDGWHAVFWGLAVVGGIGALLALLIPETHRPDPSQSLSPIRLWEDYKTFFHKEDYRRHVGASLLVFFCYYGYTAGSPELFMQQLGIDHHAYARLVSVNGLGWVVGGMTNSRLLHHYSPEALVRTQALLLLICMAIGSAMGWTVPSVISLWIAFFCFSVLMGMLIANTLSLVMASAKSHAGTAIGLQAFLQFGTGMLASALLGAWQGILPPLLLLSVAALLLALLARLSFAAPNASSRP